MDIMDRNNSKNNNQKQIITNTKATSKVVKLRNEQDWNNNVFKHK